MPFAKGDSEGDARIRAFNPLLARSIRNRFPYIDPLNHIQIELLQRHRAGATDERIVQGKRSSIIRVSARKIL